MSFDNYYCDLEDDDCFAIIPHYSYEKMVMNGIECGNGQICPGGTFIYIDILVFCKKLIFRKYKMSFEYQNHRTNRLNFKKDCSYITFTTEDNIFNNHIIIGLYGIDKVKINFTDSPKINHNPTINMIPMYFEYLERLQILFENDFNKFPTENHFEYIGSKNIYDFEGYFIYNPINEDSYKLDVLSSQDYIPWHGKYTVKTYNIYEQIVSLDSILFANYYDRRLGNDCHGRKNLKNVLIYKLYHLCKDLREKHTKKEIHYATLEDKMAEMQTEIRIKDTYTAETEQVRRDILEYKEKCNKLENKNAELVKKCNNYAIKCNKLEMTNAELVKKCDSYEMSTNIHIENISKELKLLCKSIELMNHTSNF